MSERDDQGVQFGMPVERTSDPRRTVFTLFRLLQASPPQLALVGLLAALSAGMAVAGPLLLGRATDVVVSGLGPRGIDQHRLLVLLLTATGVYCAGALTAYWSAHVITDLVQHAMSRLRIEIVNKVHRVRVSTIDSHPRGELLSRVTNDLDNVAQSLQQSLGQLLVSLLTMIGTVIAMIVVSPLLFLVVLLTVPLTVLSLRAMAGHAQGRFAAQWGATGSLNAQVEEACSGHVVIAAFGRQQAVDASFRAANEEVHDASLRAQVLAGFMQPVTMLAGNLTLVAIAVVGGLRISAGALSVGTVQAFLQYARQLTMPMTHIASMMSVLQSGLASADRVLSMLTWPDETESAPPVLRSAPQPSKPQGEVRFERVSFAYEPDSPLLREVSFTAEPGHTVAIVGPTGAGKTTLVNLLMRFYEVEGGRILLDGADIRDLPVQQLRGGIAMVLQDTWLFQASIRDNILFGDPSASEERFLEAAKAAFVDRFVHALPEGYDTIVDESGSSLSAGERQLITLARAFLADRAILVLDEATSSVDSRTELLVQQAMNELRRDRTCFVIAHRLSTIRDAETILVMERGSIVEQGNHETLSEARGAYAALLAAQSAGPAEDVA